MARTKKPSESVFKMIYQTKDDRHANATARKLKTSYEELQRHFGVSIVYLIQKLGEISGIGGDMVHHLMSQKFGGAIITHTGLSFEEIDAFFEQKMTDKANGVKFPNLSNLTPLEE